MVSQHPVGHVEALHGEAAQDPPVHVSPDGQVTHALPPDPHAPVLEPVSQNPRASQQPVGQVAGLHVGPMHAPPAHVSPGGHGRQALPPVPHAVVLVPDSQLPRLSQHPLAQVVALHVVPRHDPLVHVSPGGQATQLAPPLPQAVVLFPSTQAPTPLQQPAGHVAALHGGSSHIPALHESPGGQAAHDTPPVPHAPVVVPVSQNPSASQHPPGHVMGSHTTPVQVPAVHESPGGQGKHAAPPVPQAEVLVPVSHFPPLSQQPVGHVDALHVLPWQDPVVHVSPGGQAAHKTPPLPHALVLRPGWHTPPRSQHPAGHVVALQSGAVHVPAAHVSPDGHALQELPPVPHSPGVVPVSQKPRPSQHPSGHVFALHTAPAQTPAVQESPGGQGRHALPPVPQADVLVPVSQVPMLSQQPVGHVDALHVTPSQPPLVHVSPPGQTAHARPSLPHAEVLLPDSQIPVASQHPAGQVVALHGGASQVWLAPSQTRLLAAQS